jgi:hypothetical protein
MPHNYLSIFCLSEFDYSRHAMQVGAYRVVLLFLASSRRMSSRLICTVACIRLSFLHRAEYYLITCSYHVLFSIHPL